MPGCTVYVLHVCVLIKQQLLILLLLYFLGRAEYDCFQIELSKNYGIAEWREDVKNCLLKAGVENTAIVFLFNDTQVSQDFQFWVVGYFRFCVCVCVCVCLCACMCACKHEHEHRGAPDGATQIIPCVFPCGGLACFPEG